MSAVPPLAMEGAPPATYDHVLGCLAGFFASEALAQAVQHQLQYTHGLETTQAVLLGPAQSGWLPLTRQFRVWARSRSARGHSWVADPPLMALLSGFAMTLAVALWPIVGNELGVHLGMRSYLLLPFVGAGAGWAAAAWLPLALHYRNLDRIVRGQLAAGRWVLLVRNVPWAQQRDVLELLRDRGVGWCVVSGSRRRI